VNWLMGLLRGQFKPDGEEEAAEEED